MHAIQATCLLEFHELVYELGGDPRAILRQAEVPPDDAGRPDRLISLASAVGAVEFAAEVTSTPDFGRRLAARRGIETIGPVGIAAQTAPTLQAALTIFSTFIGAHSPGLLVRLTPVADADGRAFFEFRILLDPAPRQRQAVEIGLGAALQILRAILGNSYTPLSVHLPHSALTSPADYVRHFGCATYFAQPTAGFTLRAADLRRPLRRDDHTHHQTVQQLATLVGRQEHRLSHAISDVARTLLPTGALTIGLAAQHLGMHPRTLQRRLAGEGTTFAALVDNVRRDTAQRYLRDTNIDLGHLSRILGYSEQSVLTRSCRRWFNTNPTTYRNNGDGGVG
ncbi:AraC family transcriptional regulator [Gordonia defluvii]|jgi:AraC-like DNA-binding protein|uniref:AraC family transcriptional regulator n=1 Tax=Gordonia defluvii TaxID=283718 RepID=A0ABP6LGB5_9ACTN